MVNECIAQCFILSTDQSTLFLGRPVQLKTVLASREYLAVLQLMCRYTHNHPPVF